MDSIVTTVQHPSPDVTQMAKEFAIKLSIPFAERNRQSVASLKEKYKVSNLVVASAAGPTVHTATGEYFFHLSMAELRIKNLINGKHDHMVAAMGLAPGMSVLDCTLGLATDAIVASFVVGEAGRVVGVESQPLIALIAEYGLQHFSHDSHPEYNIIGTLRRIKVENAEHSEYLTMLPADSFDVVFFDPMFRNPIHKSSNFKPIRGLADQRLVAPEAIRQAVRVAKQKVVVKEAANSEEFLRLGITNIVGGKYSSVKYGIIDCVKMKAGGR
ncbi:class I SAM-dependent methyltransferase [Sporomusa aerivorans]|uniref:class I SAM-dependent methyltransferase n=1 Tax=Sporomusa aerivorans TaxID=204936 RepID=UPI00352A6D08